MNTAFRFDRFASARCASVVLSTILLVGCSGSSTEPSASVDANQVLWCKEHGVEEKYCVLCHPEIKGGDLLLCPEHGNIPEEICTACHPELKEKYETCPHELPTAFCPQCSPEFAATLEDDSLNPEEHQDQGHEQEGEQS